MLCQQAVFVQLQRQVVNDATEGIAGNMINITAFNWPAVEQAQRMLIIDAFLVPVRRVTDGQFGVDERLQVGAVSVAPCLTDFAQTHRIGMIKKRRQATVQLLGTLRGHRHFGISAQPQMSSKGAAVGSTFLFGTGVCCLVRAVILLLCRLIATR